MKKLMMMLLLIGATLYGQEKQKQIVTAYIKVQGNCEQCKKRIENAADIKGVKTSSWDEKTHILKVIYRADKVTEQEIKSAVAKAGHDVEGGFIAPDSTYNDLPECCKYRDKACDAKK